MKKIILLFLLIYANFPVQARITTLGAQTFKDKNGIIQHVPDFDTNPKAKKAYEETSKHFLKQAVYKSSTCQQFEPELKIKKEDPENYIQACSVMHYNKCMELRKQCDKLRDDLVQKRDKSKSSQEKLEQCFAQFNCQKQSLEIIHQVYLYQAQALAKWLSDFYTQNRNLAKPYSGKLSSNKKDEILIVENGKVVYTSTIFDFGCTKVYERNKRFYTLTGTQEHEEDKPFTGIRQLNHKEDGPTHTYTLQKYKNGLPDGPQYNESRTDRPAYKPIIYLYPLKTTEVTVKVGYPKKFTHTYPKYENGWQVLAEPNSNLTDLQTGRHLYALYWEGKNTATAKITSGFVVKGSDTISFLEEKLALLGLNEREANEFIIYWLPKLENNAYNLIYFESISQQNENMPLNITPKPDTLIRVLMEYKPLKDKIDLPEQILPPIPTRTGFTVVEWGGTELNGEIDE